MTSTIQNLAYIR